MASVAVQPPSDATRREAAMAAGVTLVAFLPSLAAGYVYDDRLLISGNEYAQSLSFLLRGFRTHLWDVHAYGLGLGLRYYRPVVTASYVLNWVASGGAAWAFHLVNVVLHAMATFLAVRVAARWTGHPMLGLAAGLIFGLHPSRTESVIWVSGRTDVLMALFALLAIELAHGAARSTRGRAVLLGAGAILSMVAAVLSKEAGALTALLVGVGCLLETTGARERRDLGRLAGTLGALGLGYLVARSTLYPVRPAAMADLTPKYGLVTVWAYLERIVWPWPQTFFYRPVEARAGVPHFPPLVLALGALACAAYTGLLAHACRRDRAAGALLLTAIALMGPLLNFSYSGIFVTTSDHFLYLPLLVLASGLLRLFRRPLVALIDERATRLAAVGVLAVYAGVDAVRVLDYRDEETLWQHELEVNPDNAVALRNLSAVRAAAGDLREAYELMRREAAPSSTRFFLLAGDPTARYSSRSRLLALEAAMTADGDARKLESIFDELTRLVSRWPSSDDGAPLGPAGLLLELKKRSSLSTVAGEAAFVGSRIGRTGRVTETIGVLPDSVLWHVSSPLNFVLTVARSGDLPRARHLLEEARRPPMGVPPAGTPEVLAGLATRLTHSERLMTAARTKPDAAARMDLAMAFAELGAYLEGLRVLRPVFDRVPHPQGVDPLYVQLLLSARLEREALATATALLGPENARTAIAQIREQLNPRLLELPQPEEPSSWWHP
jgi:hypothetical protein